MHDEQVSEETEASWFSAVQPGARHMESIRFLARPRSSSKARPRKSSKACENRGWWCVGKRKCFANTYEVHDLNEYRTVRLDAFILDKLHVYRRGGARP